MSRTGFVRNWWMRLPRLWRSVRVRLTAVYSALFLVTGIGLLAITYFLVSHAIAAGPVQGVAVSGPRGSQMQVDVLPGVPGRSSPAPQPNVDGLGNGQPVFSMQKALDNQANQILDDLLRYSALALTIMLIVAVAMGWFTAGRILRPLRTVTETVREISHSNLNRRLAATGPDDEIRQLSDTFDALLDRLEKSFDAQRRFVANASHELRTPLARQRAIAQVAISDEDASAESLRAAHERVLASGAQQERIIAALLALAQGHHHSSRTNSFDLADIAAQVLGAHPGVPDLDLTTSLAPAPLRGDARQIERLISNLVDNAVTHNIEAGTLDVTTFTARGRAVLVVANTGSEIPAERIPVLLEPFGRLEDERIGPDRGLGLGLSIVAAIAETHDAQLGIHPRVGGGLRVTVSFPADHHGA